MMQSIRFVDRPAEGYRTVKAETSVTLQDGTVLRNKYKMKSTKNLPVEYPNNSVIQSISKRFMTQAGLEPIYSASYGINWSKFVGRDMTGDLAIDLEEEIRKAMLVCHYIDDVNVEVSAVDMDKVIVNCEVLVNSKYTVSGRSEKVTLGTQLNI